MRVWVDREVRYEASQRNGDMYLPISHVPDTLFGSLGTLIQSPQETPEASPSRHSLPKRRRVSRQLRFDPQRPDVVRRVLGIHQPVEVL